MQLKNLNKNNLLEIFSVIFLFPFFLLISLHGSQTSLWGEEGAENTRFSMKISDKTIVEACKEIYKQTNYKIVLSGKIPQKKISIDIKNKTISEIIGLIIKRADITAHAVVRDSNRRLLNLKIYKSNGKTIDRADPELASLNNKNDNEIEPGLTYKKMDENTSEFNEQKQNLQDDDEVEPGFTYKDMNEAINNYEDQKKKMAPTDEIEPGLTYEMMETAIKNHNRNLRRFNLKK